MQLGKKLRRLFVSYWTRLEGGILLKPLSENTPCVLLHADDFSESKLRQTYTELKIKQRNMYFLVASDISLTQVWQKLDSILTQRQEENHALVSLRLGQDMVFPIPVQCNGKKASSLSELFRNVSWQNNQSIVDTEIILDDSQMEENEVNLLIKNFMQQMISLRLPLQLERQTIRKGKQFQNLLRKYQEKLHDTALTDIDKIKQLAAELQTAEGHKLCEQSCTIIQKLASIDRFFVGEVPLRLYIFGKNDILTWFQNSYGDEEDIRLVSSVAQADLAACFINADNMTEIDMFINTCRESSPHLPLYLIMDEPLEDMNRKFIPASVQYNETSIFPIDSKLIPLLDVPSENGALVFKRKQEIKKLNEYYGEGLVNYSLPLYTGTAQLQQCIAEIKKQVEVKKILKNIQAASVQRDFIQTETINPLVNQVQQLQEQLDKATDEMVMYHNAIGKMRNSITRAFNMDHVKAMLFDYDNRRTVLAGDLTKEVLQQLTSETTVDRLVSLADEAWKRKMTTCQLPNDYYHHQIQSTCQQVQAEFSVLTNKLINEWHITVKKSKDRGDDLLKQNRKDQKENVNLNKDELSAYLKEWAKDNIPCVVIADSGRNSKSQLIVSPLITWPGIMDILYAFFEKLIEAVEPDCKEVLEECQQYQDKAVKYLEQLARDFRTVMSEWQTQYIQMTHQKKMLFKDSRLWDQQKDSCFASWRLWQQIEEEAK